MTEPIGLCYEFVATRTRGTLPTPRGGVRGGLHGVLGRRALRTRGEASIPADCALPPAGRASAAATFHRGPFEVAPWGGDGFSRRLPGSVCSEIRLPARRRFLQCAAGATLIMWAALGLGAPASPAPAKETAPPAKSSAARVVIVTGVDYPGHPWKLTSPVLADLLRKDARLTVDIVEEPHFLGSPKLASYNVIVLHFMNWECPAPNEAARNNLRTLVAGGAGLVLVHFACGAFQDWPEFANLAGRVWDPKLRGHDPRGPFRVDIVDREHPIVQGLESFETDDELYTCLAGERPIRLLATARSKVDQKDYPMAFVLTHGKGRVFHSPLGHDVKAFQAPGVGELFRRGTAWAANLPPVPPKKTEQ